MANRLVHATSPYLLQHKDNPVDWRPWGDEAFAEARDRDVPVFLSVGYSACHWCHVMAHESFEDQQTADYLNENFVSVKVDREERPDVDAVYMEVTQAMTGQGGWPMSVMLTPDGEPFFAGTYFPREPRHGMPAFLQVLQAIQTAWDERRDEITKIGADVSTHVRASRHIGADDVDATDPDSIGVAAMAELERTFDDEHGGTVGAPKFPPSMLVEFLLRRAARTGDERALEMAERTLEAMARGGLFDQLGGGFARYSVDERWDVPHFEKMLYDNALLLRAYVHWYRQTRSPLAGRIARETADFLLRDLRTREGGFASALDADSDGREGAFYVWSRLDLDTALGPDDAAIAATRFGVSDPGNFEGGASTLRLYHDPDDWVEHADLVRRLFEERARRTHPARDGKVVAAWNGLAIAALADAGIVLGDPLYLDVAEAAAELLVTSHLDDTGRLYRVSLDGVVGDTEGLLEDYACTADGLLTLYAATGSARWFERARALVGRVLERFADDHGGYFDTADDAEQLIKRPQDAADNATPSGQAMLAGVLLHLHGLTADDAYLAKAERLLQRLAGLAAKAPRFAGHSLAVFEAWADGPRQVAVVGADGDAARQALVRAAFELAHPGVVIAQGSPSATPDVSLFVQRTLVDGHAAAYVCRDFVCQLPVTDPEAVR
ncbi:MAG TPA: thioredoxin domain-containing protein [Nocardioidaceae bacterium]|nr:thioredoxin domain-containing protein [Nocardioidaceae bacterium]